MQSQIDVQMPTTSFAPRAVGLATCGVMAAGVFVVGWFEPTSAGFFPVCPMFKLTGYACPGCGLTRGFHALFHGDVAGALGYNLLLPAFAFFFGYLFVSQFLVFWRGRGLGYKVFSERVVWTFFILALVFAVLRNVPAWPFSMLFPGG